MSYQAYAPLIIEEANRQGVDPALALAIAEQESNFNPKAVNKKSKATGLFQLMPAAAIDMGIKPSERLDPKKNIKAGIGYFKRQLDATDGDINKALANYNFGAKNVATRELPHETVNYQKDILEKRIPKFSKKLGMNGVQYAQADTGTMTDADPFAEFVNQPQDDPFAEFVQPQTPSPAPLAAAEAPQQGMIDKAVQSMPDAAKTAYGAYVEPLLTVGSGMASQFAGGVRGAYNLATGEPLDVVVQKVQDTQEAGTYLPRTEAGQNVLGHVGNAMEVAGQAINTPIAGLAGGIAAARTGSLSEGAETVNRIKEQGIRAELGAEAESMGASPEVATAAYMLPDVLLSAAPLSKAGKAPIVQESQKLDQLVGAVMQGKKADKIAFKQALRQVDPTTVKTYDDLQTVFGDKVSATANKLDEILAADTTTYPLGSLTKKTTIGETPITYNYASRAIKELDSLYKKTGNQEGEIFITGLKQKASTDGLTVKELNDLARMHGRDLNAFGADGKAPSGITKTAAENTRAGLKATARDLSQNPAFKELETEMSYLIKARDKATKNAEEVNKLRQKITDRSVGEKVGRAAFNAIDMVSGNSVSGFLRAGLVPRGGGLKTLNFIDLEKNLNTNLKKIDDILNNQKLSEAKKIDLLNNLGRASLVSEQNRVERGKYTGVITK